MRFCARCDNCRFVREAHPDWPWGRAARRGGDASDGCATPRAIESGLAQRMRDIIVNYQRSNRTFTVRRRDGRLIVDRLESIEDAWRIAESAQRQIDDQRAMIDLEKSH